MRKMTRMGVTAFGFLLLLGGCDSDSTLLPAGQPAPPQALEGRYYAYAVHLDWELDSRWSGESFRVYGRRATDRNYLMVAQVTNCSDGVCAYTDRNVIAGVKYEYYVSAVHTQSGNEAQSDYAVEVFVPQPTAPPAPGEIEAVGLDDALYLRWDRRSRQAEDLHFYRVYLDEGDDGSTLLGETDSEGFLDLLVQNGFTYGYFVTAVDTDGHESGGSPLAEGTPRPDYHGEFIYAFEDRPDLSGFRFQETESTNPIRPGGDGGRHFRMEVDEAGWWLVPGTGVEVHQVPIATTALRCGPAADSGCVDVDTAPSSNYSSADVGMFAGFSYVLRVPGEGGGWRYGVIRVTHTGWAQDGAIAIFDWAFQLQVGNPALSPGTLSNRAPTTP